MTKPGYYSLSRTVAPSELAVSLAEARQQLRVDTTGSPAVAEDDDIITTLIDAITQDLDAGTGWLGRAICPQTWRLSLSQFPSVIRIPFPPLISVVSLTYTDLNGDVQTMTEGTDFRVVKEEGIAAAPACIVPVYLGTFPAARTDFDTVQLVFQCGYGAGSPLAADVPDIIKRYILSALTVAYDTRDSEAGAATSAFQRVPAAVRNSLENLRVREQFYR